MDFWWFLRAVRQHRVPIAAMTAAGIGLAVVYSVVSPPMLTATAQVEVQLPVSHSVSPIGTQVLIASSNEVLEGAGRAVRPAASLTTMQQRVRVTSLTPDVLAVTGSATSGSRAEALANAVARSYLAYIRTPRNAAGSVTGGLVIQPAGTTRGSVLGTRLAEGFLGAGLGLLAGIIAALALSRADKRLRRRDDIADAVGIPVLASIPAARPADAAGWKKLLDAYEPAAVDAWSLRKALRQIGLTDVRGAGTAGTSLMVITLAGDHGALALGPQIAVFAASLGIPTSLAVGAQPGQNVTATLVAACGATAGTPSGPGAGIRVGTGVQPQPGVSLTVVVTVVDDRAPQLSEAMPTTVTLLGVSSGAATAEQLARVAVRAASDGREITGIVVADADPTDPTTGRLPRLERLTRRKIPTRMPDAVETG